MNHHGQNARARGFFLAAALFDFKVWPDDIGQGGVLENPRSRVADIEKYLIEGAVLEIAINQAAQLLGVAKRCQGAVNQANDLAQTNLGRRTAQLISALGAA